MIRLTLPENIQDHEKIIDLCCEKNIRYKSDILTNKNFLLAAGNCYNDLSATNDLYLLNDKLPEGENINGNLKNEYMVQLYNYCLRDCRCGNIYDTIINLAKSPEIQCPFCGGISIPSQLDHFLPKVRYGHFAVFPYNLIPICKDCNTEYKKEFLPTTKGKQLIHPYLDDNCFFNQQWLYAKYINSTIEYSVEPPNDWSNDKKEKVLFHFEIFKLKERFAQNAVGTLSDLLVQIENSKLYGMDMDIFEKSILDSVIQKESRINHWKRVLYSAVKSELQNIWQESS
ncbi:HNH endonuclease [Neisseria zalophi]|uniref:HNH endonuclease n=1 Tax=Neisseria zalophi TaxID=640030 RepID=A0A5J6PT69_9NEIS|nr:hypothetical protein [Neisseria zalophi]QEY25911.1 hypothetical protein D0T92_04760 [Neisseria zalophi]